MPSKSKKQHRFMMAVAHSAKFAKKAGVPQSVGKEFEEADEEEGKMANKDKRKESKGRKPKK